MSQIPLAGLLARLAARPPMPWYVMVLFAAIALLLLWTGVRDFRAGTTAESGTRALPRTMRGEDAKMYTGGQARLISGIRVVAALAVLGVVAYPLLS